MAIRRIIAIAFSIAVVFTLGCKPRSGTPSKDQNIPTQVVDLRRIAPIGYEICGDHHPVTRRAKLVLTLQLPNSIAVPSGDNQLAKAILFRPGEHEVDLYKNLHSERLLHTTALLSIENGVPTIHVSLMTYRLRQGQYVLGISGDPIFA